MRNIKDWCVSRQLWWGHRIPAWYDEAGRIYVGRDEPEVRRKHSLPDSTTLTQDPDVLDTWFSSALWPFSTLGWPDATPELRKFYPTSVLVTGFDIIFFWVARMMMMGLKFMGDVPFKHVYITGLIRDEHGEKMSKSKGNVIDPLDIVDGIALNDLVAKRTSGLMQPQMKDKIEKATRKQFPEGIAAFGTDALRFTFAALAGPSRDINFDLGRVGGNRNFCNKLWNASRFVLMTVENSDLVGEAELSVADRWIVSRLSATLVQLNQALTDYRFDRATARTGHLSTARWYLDSKRCAGRNTTEGTERGTRRALVTTLGPCRAASADAFITKAGVDAPLAAPPRPGHRQATTDARQHHAGAFPANTDFAADAQASSGVDQASDSVRDPWRNGYRAVAQDPVATAERRHAMRRWPWPRRLSTRLAGLEGVRQLAAGESAPESATAIVGELTLLVPMAGLIDPKAEIERLTKRIAKNDSDLGKLKGKLANENFVRNAPPDVVAADRARVAELEAQNASLASQLERVRRIGSG
jgi:valyl-tRNA synthetase